MRGPCLPDHTRIGSQCLSILQRSAVREPWAEGTGTPVGAVLGGAALVGGRRRLRLGFGVVSRPLRVAAHGAAPLHVLAGFVIRRKTSALAAGLRRNAAV